MGYIIAAYVIVLIAVVIAMFNVGFGYADSYRSEKAKWAKRLRLTIIGSIIGLPLAPITLPFLVIGLIVWGVVLLGRFLGNLKEEAKGG